MSACCRSGLADRPGRCADTDHSGAARGLTTIVRTACLSESDRCEQVAPPQIDPGRSSCRQRRKLPPQPRSAAPAKAAPQTTVTLKHLAAALSDSHDLPKKQAEAVLGDLVTLTTRHLKKGDKIRLNGPRHPPGAEACRQDGTEPSDRRGDQDQGEQEGRLPGCQGTEGSGVGRCHMTW